MSSPIEAIGQTGLNLYAVIHANGQVWNTSTPAFEAYNSAHWSQYAVSLTEQTGSGYYSAAYPTAISAGTLSTEVLYRQIGGSPTLPSANGDPFYGSAQSQGVNIQTIAYLSAPAIGLSLSAQQIIMGTVEAGTISNTQMTTNLVNSLVNAYVGRTIIWTSGQLTACAAAITAFVPTNGLLSFSAVTTSPANGDQFIII